MLCRSQCSYIGTNYQRQCYTSANYLVIIIVTVAYCYHRPVQAKMNTSRSKTKVKASRK